MSHDHHHCKCGCEAGKCTCHPKEHHHDHCGECHHESQSYADQLLQLADDAWMEVLKETIKQEIRDHSDENIKELAKLVSQANHDRWKKRLQEKTEIDHYKEHLKDLLGK